MDPKRVPLAAVQSSLIDSAPSPERACELSLLRSALKKVLTRLSAERHQVLALTFGTPRRDGLNPAGYSYGSEEIARILNVSSYRIHAVRNVTLALLRNGRESRRLLLPFLDALS